MMFYTAMGNKELILQEGKLGRGLAFVGGLQGGGCLLDIHERTSLASLAVMAKFGQGPLPLPLPLRAFGAMATRLCALSRKGNNY